MSQVADAANAQSSATMVISLKITTADVSTGMAILDKITAVLKDCDKDIKITRLASPPPPEYVCRFEEVDEVRNAPALSSSSSDAYTAKTPIPQDQLDCLIDDYFRPEIKPYHGHSAPLSGCIIFSEQNKSLVPWEEPPLFDSIPRGVVLDVNFLERLKDEEKKRTQPQ